MKSLVEIKRETYGHGPRAINLHRERHYEDKVGNRYILSCTLDGIPPFFEAYGPFKADHEGLLPRRTVSGQEYWGTGWTWRRALRAFCSELNAVVVSRLGPREAGAAD